MQLSMQDFAAVVEAMRRGSAERAAGAERRTTQRINLQVPVEAVPLSGLDTGRLTKVITIDISVDSLGFYATSRIAVRDQLMLMLPHSQRHQMVTLFTVMRASEVADGLYHVGGKLVAQSPAEILRQIEPNEDLRLTPIRLGLQSMASGAGVGGAAATATAAGRVYPSPATANAGPAARRR
jgi:hypothetical protein